MNISVIIGLVIAFGALLGGYGIEGGSVASLLLPSPFIIVFGGTLGAVIASYGITELVGGLKAFMKCLLGKGKPNPDDLIQRLSQMADRCRQEGLLVLDTMVKEPELTSEQYLLLKQGMNLIMDMKNFEQVQDVLEADIRAFTLKRQLQIEVFDGAAGYSPTMGVIGTVMGLVQVLSNMSDAEELTAAIAVAFVATLYGVVFANIIYMPIASVLKQDLKRQKIFKQMIVEGIIMVASGETSRGIENKLSLYHQAFPKGDKKYAAGINS